MTRRFVALVLFALAATTWACSGAAPATPPNRAGTAAAPREVNIIAKDWLFVPDPVELIPGETVLFHVVNGGLAIHEVVIGDAAVQDAWEVAEAAGADHPPGPTPAVSVPPAVAGLRLVVESGQRVDATWTVPAGLGSAVPSTPLTIGCHIPGHWAKGMVVAIRLAGPQTGP